MTHWMAPHMDPSVYRVKIKYTEICNVLNQISVPTHKLDYICINECNCCFSHGPKYLTFHVRLELNDKSSLRLNYIHFYFVCYTV